jgi:hypothetical protein
MLDFKSLSSTRNAFMHAQCTLWGVAEVRQEQVKSSYRAAVKNLDLTQNKTPPGMIGTVEEIIYRYGVRGSGCTGLIISKHGNLSSAFLHIRGLITLSRVGIATATASLLTMHWGCSIVRSTAVGDWQRPGHGLVYWLSVFKSWYPPV